uniref:Uncharacterized protein n=1 Tax=viral metagenome TaxID=1070528 RepID=A0A6M3LGS3_9ZZZZ
MLTCPKCVVQPPYFLERTIRDIKVDSYCLPQILTDDDLFGDELDSELLGYSCPVCKSPVEDKQ